MAVLQRDEVIIGVHIVLMSLLKGVAAKDVVNQRPVVAFLGWIQSTEMSVVECEVAW